MDLESSISWTSHVFFAILRFKANQEFRIMVRVRFAPSPTGPLHIGGVRTALYNYLWAKKNGGDFILRIEDTDQKRYVEGAEAYIHEALSWLGLKPDEGPEVGGEYGPYRQSQRSQIYQKHIQILLDTDRAYYAFDTTEELEKMREAKSKEGIHSPKYDYTTRMFMTNSLTLSKAETQERLDNGMDYVIRLRVDPGSKVGFMDAVRGSVSFDTSELDDKVLMKSDGLPTYHFANVVDDHLMRISHVIRGEEWLSSTGLHVLLYESLGWIESMPTFVHLPLILKPQGKGKLSKRDGAKFGIPVFPLEWQAGTAEVYMGFREAGFHPAATINFLALLGWNPGSEKEIFSIEELIESFELEEIVKSGARFDYDKACWFNKQYIIIEDAKGLIPHVENVLKAKNVVATKAQISKVAELYYERIENYNELWSSIEYCFQYPVSIDEKSVKKKYKADSDQILETVLEILNGTLDFKQDQLSNTIKTWVANQNLSMGKVFPVLRLAITGTLKGPDIFGVMEVLGKEQSIERLKENRLKFNKIINN